MSTTRAPKGFIFAVLLGLGIAAASLVVHQMSRGGSRPAADESPDSPDAPANSSRAGTGGSGAVGSRSAGDAPCANHPLWPEEGAIRRYRLSVGDTEAMMEFALVERRAEGEELVDSYLVTISSELIDEPIESRMERRCSDAAGAEEMWTGTSFAGLTTEARQEWRWPLQLQTGVHFAGDLRRRVLGMQQVVHRDHLVEGVEPVSTPSGTFDSWRVHIEDQGENGAASTEGTQWVAAGVGLVRLEQETPFGRVTLELMEHGSLVEQEPNGA